MNLYPYNPLLGQRLQSAVEGTRVDQGFLAHIEIAATSAAAASTTAVLAFSNLKEAAQNITAGLASPVIPRNVQIDGNVSGITGVVTVEGTNYAGEVITEAITANGTTAVEGAKAFKTITKVTLPIQNHTPAAQSETQQITNGATTGAGTITVAVTAAALGDASPKSVDLEVEADDTAAEVAAKIVAAFNLDEDVSATFTASVTGEGEDTITLTANDPATNDATLAMAFTDTDTTGVTAGSSSDGVTGVAYDQISVGWGDRLGLPYFLSHNTVLAAYFGGTKEGTAPSVTTDAVAIESNTIDLHSALDGSNAVDIYLIV